MSRKSPKRTPFSSLNNNPKEGSPQNSFMSEDHCFCLTLENIAFDGADLTEFEFVDCEFINCSFKGATYDSMTFLDCEFVKCEDKPRKSKNS